MTQEADKKMDVALFLNRHPAFFERAAQFIDGVRTELLTAYKTAKTYKKWLRKDAEAGGGKQIS